ncbi:HAUS6 protein, partial [Sagittarius serpentarius]|nr:HAUS6 protein [Sagittarius serpentarius]
AYRMKQKDQNKNDRTERIEKVRSMWTLIMEILTSLKEEKEAVDSVLEDCADQCILDGTDVVLHIPQLLIQRVECNVPQTYTGNLYEAEKLNFLTVILLLNEALRAVRDEHCQCELKQLQVIENSSMQCHRLLQNVAANRLKAEQERIMSMSGSTRQQEDWEEKWKTFLGRCPFNFTWCQYPVSSVQFI